jgi:periplasmic protein TonB
VVQFTLGLNGEVNDVKAIRSSHPAFAAAAIRIVKSYRCVGQAREAIVTVPFAFKSEE